ncbi:MAG: CBS domain-containing protein [Proteobacteria bacterium]|nr:CBS domain-containing protein [Pseudomonadota bacterium]
MQTARKFMTTHPICVECAALIPTSAQLMMRHSIRHLPVLDNNGLLAGIIADFDVFQRGGLVGAYDELWVFFDNDDEDLCVGSLASTAHTTRPDTPILQVLEQLASNLVEIIVVTDHKNKPLGVICEHDAMKMAHQLLPDSITAESAITRPAQTLDLDEDAQKAWQIMEARQIRHIIATEEDELQGVVSYRDLIADGVPSGRSLRLGDVIRGTAVQSISGGSLADAAQLMARHKIGCLPFVDKKGRPLGVLTRTDILKTLVHLDSFAP